MVARQLDACVSRVASRARALDRCKEQSSGTGGLARRAVRLVPAVPWRSRLVAMVRRDVTIHVSSAAIKVARSSCL